MGQAKKWMVEQQARGFQWVADRSVCDACVDDESLREHIQDNAVSDHCDYCGRQSDEPIACDLDTFLYAIADGIAVEWIDAEEQMPYEGDGWAFPDDNTDIRDMIDTIGLELRNGLYDDVVTAFEDRAFARRHFFSTSPEDALVFGWNDFVRHVSHTTRYLFTTVDPPADFAGPADIPPSKMLSEIGRVVAELGLVQPMAPQELFRGRVYRNSEPVPVTAAKLGSPPVDKAMRSNRMSPLGIPMFYGGLDEITAVQETAAVGIKSDEAMQVGVFVADRPLNVVDLAALPPIPSLFDRGRRDVRPSIIFLHHFAEEVSKHVDRSQDEHLEYVPTQIVTEYFRHIFGTEHGPVVDGLLYRSAVQDGGICIVLFIDNRHCVDVAQPGARTLALIDSHGAWP